MQKNKKDIDFDKEFEDFEEELNEKATVSNEQEDTKQENNEEQSVETQNKEQFYLDLAQRVQAEFDNYRKRTKQAEIDAKQKGKMDAVLELLPIIDSLDNAKKVIKNDCCLEAISIIEKQIYLCFDALGVKKIEALNKPFDPNLHNAIMCGNNPEFEEDTILQVFQEGFTLNDKVIRYSMVEVNKL